MERVHKAVLNAVAIGAFVSGSMAASAPTHSDHQATSAKLPMPASSKSTSKASSTSKPFAVGQASWYGKAFDGKTTAIGEPYDMYELTAAHRTLRLGSWVKVTNLRNHRWVLVRINDRGPFTRGRIIDLTPAAAGQLGFSGLAPVNLSLVGR